jgi:hypothetical protein
MKRDKITIDENTVTIVGNEVWMTGTELAELFGTSVGAVNGAIKAVIKSDVLNDYEVCKYVRLENGNGADVYNMEVITALAFRLNTYPAAVFRKWLIRQATAPVRATPPIIIQYKEGFLN